MSIISGNNIQRSALKMVSTDTILKIVDILFLENLFQNGGSCIISKRIVVLYEE